MILLLSLSGIFVAEAAGAIMPPANLPRGTEIPCPHDIPGFTRTIDMTFFALGDLNPLLAILNSQALNDQFPGDWRYVAGADTVNGQLNVTNYVPVDAPGACEHGAQLEMNLAALAGLPAGQQFNWLQYYNETGNSGNGVNVLDPPNGVQIFNGTMFVTADALPFYSQANFNGGLGSTTFGDFPFDLLPDTDFHAGSVTFLTFLTSWDGTPPPNPDSIETVNVYGAVRWGYQYACVPEPSSAVLALVGLITTTTCCYRRSIQRAGGQDKTGATP